MIVVHNQQLGSTLLLSLVVSKVNCMPNVDKQGLVENSKTFQLDYLVPTIYS